MRGSDFDRLSHGLCSRHEAQHMPRLRLAPPCSRARSRVAVAELGVVRRHSRIPMNSRRIFTILFIFALSLLGIADEPKFFAARGEYPLASTTTLIVSDIEQLPHFTLRSVVQQAGTPTTVSHGGELSGARQGEPYLIYWHADTQTLWWATRRRIGYCDIHNPQSAKSAEQDRAQPIRNTFPKRPKAFDERVGTQLSLQP